MQAVRICFPFGVLLLGGLEIFSVIYAQILARRREFACFAVQEYAVLNCMVLPSPNVLCACCAVCLWECSAAW